MAKKKSIDAMFPNLFDGEYYLGTSIGNGWRKIVNDACQSIQDGLKPEDLKLFHFVQIKEKFAGLCMYYHPTRTLPVTIITDDSISDFDFPSKEQDKEPMLSPEGKLLVDRIISNAAALASKTCEVCGSEGRLYQDNYWCIRCDRHAAEEEKIFPRAYGELIGCRPHATNFGDKKAVCTHLLYFKNTAAKAWYWTDEVDYDESNQCEVRRQFVILQDLPRMLGDAFMDQGNIELAYLEEDDTPQITMLGIWVDEFLEFIKKYAKKGGKTQELLSALLKLPENCRFDARTELERRIAEDLGINAQITHFVPGVIMNGFAVGQLADGTCQLFRITKEGLPDDVTSPRHTLDSAIKNLNKLLESLKVARELFKESKS